MWMRGNVTVVGLKPSASYTIVRFVGTDNLPADASSKNIVWMDNGVIEIGGMAANASKAVIADQSGNAGTIHTTHAWGARSRVLHLEYAQI